MKILVVDDDASVREILLELLCSEGHEVQTAVDGKKALSILQKHSFELIVSDIQMPQLDGIEFGRRFREVDIATPILFFSAVLCGLDAYANEIKAIGNASFIENKNFDRLLSAIRETA